MSRSEPTGMNTSQSTSDTTGQVLRFLLEDATYCVAIDAVAEIVDSGETTLIPNSPPSITGVMDLRGTTTTIVDPKVPLNIRGDTDPKRIVVFDGQHTDSGGPVGWLVDEVESVIDVSDIDVEPSLARDETVRGLIHRDGEFVIWLSTGAFTTQ